MSVPAAPALQPEQLRTLSGFFATGVTVVLADHAGQRWGMMVNSFTSLSLDPPLVLFCAQTGSSVLHAIEASRVFTVNVLAIEQVEISSQLARRGGPEKMHGIEMMRVPSGAPRLAQALTWFDCELQRCEPAGDHSIIIGRVMSGGRRESGGEPLLFYRGAYRTLRAAD